MTGRIRNTPGVAPTVAPSTVDRPAAPSTPAAPSQPEPARGWQPRANVPPRVVATVANAIKNAGPSDFDMVPGRYPDAVALPTVLQGIGASPQGQAALGKVLDGIKAKTGVEVPADIRAAALSNPAALTKAFELTPKQLSDGIVGLNAAYKAGKLKKPEEPPKLLPQSGFDLSKLDELDAPRPKSELKELAPGLFQGDLPSATSDAQVKRNRVLAEVFGRLSANASAPEGSKFSVDYGGKSFTKLDDFVGALKKDGYDVQVRFDSRVANFSNLKTAIPGTNPPKFVDVPAPLMVKTGIKDASGKEAVVPAVHSEMVISLKAGPNTKGPKFDADLKFYQGVSGTGFFPCNVHADPSWCGRVTTATLSGNDALKAVKVAGAFSDVVNSTAKSMNLYADGYGVTGVCNDSVAVVQQATTGKATQYPLLMKDAVLMPELSKRLGDADKADDPTYKSIRNAIRDLPSDTRATPSSKARALASMPWAAGREPFTSSEEARRILSN